MFENQTQEAILSRMLNNISDEVDKREGSVARDMLTPKSIELAMAYLELENVLRFGFAETTYGEFLDLKVAEVGLTRRPAQKASGRLVITNTTDEPITIPAGTIAYTNSGVQFEIVDENVIVNQEPVEVRIVAVKEGVIGNVAVNSIVNIEITGLECTNPDITSGGMEIESDEELLERYYIQVKKSGVSGNKHHYRQWATEVTGIGDARVIPTWNGPNTVKIIVIDTNKQPVNPDKLQEVIDYIEVQRPIGAQPTVVSAQYVDISISASLTIKDGFLLDDIVGEIVRKIQAYFKEVTFVENEIKHSRIGNIIFTTEGVDDYKNLLINGSTENFILGDEDIPHIGQVTFA